MHIGVISCEILRKEITEVIKRTGVGTIFFVVPEATNLPVALYTRKIYERFSKGLTEEGIKPKQKTFTSIIKEIREKKIKDSLIIRVLELQLHDRPDKLVKEIDYWIQKMNSVVDCIILGFGLCGSTAREMERVINGAEVPILIPRDEKGEILNNCIEIALGRKRVQELMQEEVGTFFMTPVGASIIKEPQVILESTIGIMAGNVNRSAIRDTPRIIQLMKNHYQRVVKICYSEADEQDDEYSETIEQFAKNFGLEIKVEKRSLRVMNNILETCSSYD
jgi:hypothetical protein